MIITVKLKGEVFQAWQDVESQHPFDVHVLVLDYPNGWKVTESELGNYPIKALRDFMGRKVYWVHLEDVQVLPQPLSDVYD